VPPEKRIEYRVGIHLGDVVEEADGDLMGDGVNIAARLEGVASPGAICLSEQAYWQVKGRLDLKVTDLGAIQLKNIAEPIHVFSLEVGNPVEIKPEPAASPSGRSGPPRLSLVVLPFANIGGDPEQEYFVDGVTESLTTDLSRVSGAFVIGRRTAFTYKSKTADVTEIGRELNVRYALEGSVQRDHNRVRINAQLVDAESGAHLWADRFDEDVTDLFKVQDRVVERLVGSLGYVLINAEAKKGARSANQDVIDLTMRGWTLIWRAAQQTTNERRERCNEARALFDQALSIEPDDPDALAGNAYTYYLDFAYGWSDAPTNYEARVLAQTSRAIALAPDNVRAYFVKASYLSLSQRPGEAIGVADAGLAINPNFVLLLAPRAAAGNSLGRFAEAKADCDRAISAEPARPF
jgi:adenylate cyclase